MLLGLCSDAEKETYDTINISSSLYIYMYMYIYIYVYIDIKIKSVNAGGSSLLGR